MPQELRTIIFDAGEIHEAMAAFALRQKMPMPAGSVESVTFAPDREPALLLGLRVPGAPVIRTVGFRKAEVAAALILYCRERRIPLPKDALKNVIDRNGCPALHVQL